MSSPPDSFLSRLRSRDGSWESLPSSMEADDNGQRTEQASYRRRNSIQEPSKVQEYEGEYYHIHPEGTCPSLGPQSSLSIEGDNASGKFLHLI